MASNELAVVISVYNGANFLLRQLESILDEHQDIVFYIRDDGSTDNSERLILSFFRDKTNVVHYYSSDGRSLGAAKSFWYLLQQVREPYIFLSDQDDVWSKGRVASLMAKLGEVEKGPGGIAPSLVFSDVAVVSEDLGPISESFWKFQKAFPAGKLTLNRLLVQNYAPGCSMVFNKALIDGIKYFPDEAIMHDWYLVIACAALGKVGYINDSTLLYRQHSYNSIGASKFSLFSYLREPKKLLLLKSTLSKTRYQANSIESSLVNCPAHHHPTFSGYEDLFGHSTLRILISFFRYRFFKSNIPRTVSMLLILIFLRS